MKVRITDKEKVVKFAIIFSNLKSHYKETNLYFRKSGLYLQTTDTSLISMVQLEINKDWFDIYDVDIEQVIGIHIETFDKILSCIDKDYTIELNLREETDKLNIILSDGKIIKEYEMNLMDLDSAVFDIPELEHTADIMLDSSVFKDYINELIKFGDDLNICCNETEIILSSTGDEGKSKIIINEEYLEEYSIIEDETIDLTFTIKIIKMVSNFVKLNKITNIHISDGKPLKIEYNIDENENKLTFFLAPKIKDD
jgi:proliferating cell nuclear antigen PCNA